uniref:Guanine nucleotide binding protein (G protein), beta polypeptide 1-like n=1 Tax=Oncorhynchus kisutch TaxID=8019 RepID=A0A8C7DGN9_ONCKI
TYIYVSWCCVSVRCFVSQGRIMHVCLWDLAEGRSAVRQTVWGSVTCQCALIQITPALSAQPCGFCSNISLPLSSYSLSLPPPSHLTLSHMRFDVSQRSVLSNAAVHHEPVMCLDFDPTRQSAVSGSSEEGLYSWMLDGQHRLQVSEALVNPGISQLCIWGDSKLAASAVWDLHVQAFGWMNLRPLAVLQHHPDMVLSLALLRPPGLQGPRHQHLVHNKPELRFRHWVNHWALCIL